MAFPAGVLLADAAYGTSRDFRDGIRELGLHYIVGVDPKTAVAVFDRRGRRRDDPVSVRDLAFRVAKQGGFRRCTWRKGTKEDLTARFALRRVVPAYDQCYGMEKREPVWLLIEWRDGETEPANYFPLLALQPDDEEAADPPGHAEMAHGARLRRLQG